MKTIKNFFKKLLSKEFDNHHSGGLYGHKMLVERLVKAGYSAEEIGRFPFLPVMPSNEGNIVFKDPMVIPDFSTELNQYMFANGMIPVKKMSLGELKKLYPENER